MLYKYVFTTRKTLTFQSRHSHTSVPPIFPPLSEARSSQEVLADLAAAEAAVARAPELSADAETLQQVTRLLGDGLRRAVTRALQEGISSETRALIAERVNAEVPAFSFVTDLRFKF